MTEDSLLYGIWNHTILNWTVENVQTFPTQLMCWDADADELGECCASVLWTPECVSHCQRINVQLLADNVATGQGPPPEPCGVDSMAQFVYVGGI